MRRSSTTTRTALTRPTFGSSSKYQINRKTALKSPRKRRLSIGRTLRLNVVNRCRSSLKVDHREAPAPRRRSMKWTSIKSINYAATSRTNRMMFIRGQKFRVNPMSIRKYKNFSRNTNDRNRYKVVNKKTPVKYTYSIRKPIVVRSILQKYKIFHPRPKPVIKETDKYCIFFNRFGKCKRNDKCKYVHDKDKIAICKRFLRGKCDVSHCPFSHVFTRGKMATCFHFSRSGGCNKGLQCPYRHVLIETSAKICNDFARGYCPNSNTCLLKHTLICDNYNVKTGQCLRTDELLEGKDDKTLKRQKCTLKHPVKRTTTKVKAKKRKPRKDKLIRTSEIIGSKLSKSDLAIPFSQRILPEKIMLANSDDGEDDDEDDDEMEDNEAIQDDDNINSGINVISNAGSLTRM